MNRYGAIKWLLAFTLLWLTNMVMLQSQEEASNVLLVEAIRQKNADEARKIFHSGTKINVRDNHGTTPLLEAIRSGFPELASEFLDRDADPNLSGGEGDRCMRFHCCSMHRF